MDNLKVRRYYTLKQKQKELEQELGELRQEILAHCVEQGATDLEIGNYRVKVIQQDRKEYDDSKLQEALPDLEVWKLISRADNSKIAGMVALHVLSEEALKDTFTVKKVSSLQVEKK
jgi:hypothetical protein